MIAIKEHRLGQPSPFERDDHNHSELETQETDMEREEQNDFNKLGVP